MTFDEAALATELPLIKDSLDERHRDVDVMLLRQFDAIAASLPRMPDTNDAQRRLIEAIPTHRNPIR